MPLKARQVARILEQHGFVLLPERGKGSHRVYRHAVTRRTTLPPWHGGGADIQDSLLTRIAHQAGLATELFR